MNGIDALRSYINSGEIEELAEFQNQDKDEAGAEPDQKRPKVEQNIQFVFDDTPGSKASIPSLLDINIDLTEDRDDRYNQPKDVSPWQGNSNNNNNNNNSAPWSGPPPNRHPPPGLNPMAFNNPGMYNNGNRPNMNNNHMRRNNGPPGDNRRGSRGGRWGGGRRN